MSADVVDAGVPTPAQAAAPDSREVTEMLRASQGPPLFKMPLAGQTLASKKLSCSTAFSGVEESSSKHGKALDASEQSNDRETTNDEQKERQPEQDPSENDTPSGVDTKSDESEPYTKVAQKKPAAKSTKSGKARAPIATPPSASGVDYREPVWGGGCDDIYYFEAVKNGTVVDKLDLSVRSYHVVGRLPSCDFAMDHPSLSRHHAVIQHCTGEEAPEGTPTEGTTTEGSATEGASTGGSAKRAGGWYLYDLDSTHGTWINKHKITPRVYCRLRVGYVVKFGGSSRLYVLQGPPGDQDDESELSVAEMKTQRERQASEAEVLRRIDAMDAAARLSLATASAVDSGCSWGFTDDAETTAADNPDAPNPFAAPDNEILYIDDPKKTLRGYFEREGYDLPEYEFTDEGRGRFRCSVKLPVDTPSGDPLVAEASGEGKKKDLVVACALEACRMLDRQGVLRQATHEGRQSRRRRNWEESNYYDSDEDNFLDRTGDLEAKRQRRMQRGTRMEGQQRAETFESLTTKLGEARGELEEAEGRLEADRDARAGMEAEGVDALDAFMSAIKAGGTLDSKTRTTLKHRVAVLRQQVLRLEQLVSIARPAVVTLALGAAGPAGGAEPLGGARPTRALPIMGKMKCAVKPVRTVVARPKNVLVKEAAGEEEEEEDDDDDEVVKDESASRPCASEKKLDVRSMVSHSNNATEANVVRDTDGFGAAMEVDRTVLDDAAAKKKTSSSAPAAESTDISGDLDLQKAPHVTKEKKSAQAPRVLLEMPTKGSSGPGNSGGSASQTENKTKKKTTVGVGQKPNASLFEPLGDEFGDTWMPPRGQSGDGKTQLNSKFGY